MWHTWQIVVKNKKKYFWIVMDTIDILIIFVVIVIIIVLIAFTSRNMDCFEGSFDVPDDTLYVVYSIGNSGYQEWQGDLLDFSFVLSKQPGTLIRLVSDDSQDKRKINKTKYGYTLITPDFSRVGDKVWPVMNKPGSMKYLMDALSPEWKTRNQNATFVFLDPDMIFTKPWDPRDKFTRGQVYGQKWKGYSRTYCEDTSIRTELCPDSEEDGPIMFPFAMKVGDFDNISDDISEFAKKGYLKKSQWMADMSAFVTAIEKAGYKNIQIDNLGLCNNWNNKDDESAPIVHFCQSIKNSSGKKIWSKHHYQRNYTYGDRFQDVPDPSEAVNRVDREVLQMIKKLIASQK